MGARGIMSRSVSFYGAFNNQTGYGFHATHFTEALEKYIPVHRNQMGGEISISLLDSVSVQNITGRLPHKFNILYNVWESTEQPQWFMDRLKYFDQLWVPSEWQRACSITQGVPEEFVRVVPEGLNPDVFKPIDPVLGHGYFNFLHIGQWQPRKSTKEICEAFSRAFPDNKEVRLYLGADTNFPSDEYKSTEERLTAYQLDDPRIIPVRFEEHLDDEKLLKLFSKTDCYVSCSRSEGWGITTLLAMACGIPTIVEDWGAATEYNEDAMKVRVPTTRRPFGIYGNWAVPGEWGEPDYTHLMELMQNTYYTRTPETKLLKMSERVRRDFSWDAAAKKAVKILDEIRDRPEFTTPRRNAIFAVDCWPSSQAKMETLVETIRQIHGFGYQVLVTSHYPLPAPVTELADYYVFEKRDIMSGDDKPVYWRKLPDGTVETTPCKNEYQGVAALNCLRNAIDFCRGKWDWVYQMSADMEVDLTQWLELVETSKKPMACIPYEGIRNGIGGGLWAGRTEVFDQLIPYLDSWEQYADMYPDERFIAERWIFNYVASKCNIEKTIDWIEIETTNRFDNVDHTAWQNDEFRFNFVDGAYLDIKGVSDREYEVRYSTPENPNIYTTSQKVGMWSRANIKYYQDWTIEARLNGELKFGHTINLNDKRVLISMGSRALGDTLAWIPYVEEFRKKHKCHVVCSTWWNTILDYPGIEFVQPGAEVQNIYAAYQVGCFDNQLDRNVVNWRETPLQRVSADILGLDYVPIRPKLKVNSVGYPALVGPYICFSEFSTMQNKQWNRPGAWQNVIDYLKSLGYQCVAISMEQSGLQGIVNHCGQSIEQTIADLSGAYFYIGLNHGPVWLAYALDIPAVMITGVSEVWNDFENPYRVSAHTGCRPCFNDTTVSINRSWDWCENGTDKFVCTKSITEEMVIDKINILHEDIQLCRQLFVKQPMGAIQ